MSSIKTYPDQSVFDIALQEYGSVEGVFDLLRANPGLEFDSEIVPGTILSIEAEPVKKEVVDFYKNNNIKPATGKITGLPVYNENENDMIEKVYNYNIANGDKTFESIRLYNLNRIVALQINYTAINANDVRVIIESSLDNENFSQIPGANFAIDNTLQSINIEIIDLVTLYIRLRVEVNSATEGTIDKMIIKL